MFQCEIKSYTNTVFGLIYDDSQNDILGLESFAPLRIEMCGKFDGY